MPRPRSIRKNLSHGWRRLHRLQRSCLESKVSKANDLLTKAFKAHARPLVCWSGGKYSTIVLHLVLQYRHDVPIIYVNSGVEFRETVTFVRQLAAEWNLNLTEARPAKDQGFWHIGTAYGWPIFGKAVASNVERARRTGNIRPQLSAFERRLVRAGLRVSAKCSEFLQDRPSKRAEEKIGSDLKILGLRATESRARVRLWVDHGDYYFVKRYFGRNRGMWKLNPIATWTEGDVWEYHRVFGLPYCKLYDMGYPRNGCWTCAMGARKGQLGRLRKHHPRLFRRLLTNTPMGKELMKAKLLFAEKQWSAAYSLEDIGRLLTDHPDAFDRL